MSENHTITMTDNNSGKSVDCEVSTGTHGRDVVDIRPLTSELGYFTHDPGFASTSACRSTNSIAAFC